MQVQLGAAYLPWYNSLSIERHWRPGTTPIPPPPVMPSRRTRLGTEYAKLFTSTGKHFIAVTIQPNYGYQDGAQGSAKLKLVTRSLFYLGDCFYTGCPRPEWLPQHRRFQGFGVIEKRRTNPHIHFLLSCQTHMDWRCRLLFLLAAFDNTPNEQGRQEDWQWRIDARAFLAQHPWSDNGRWNASESLVSRFAPSATCMVQPLRTSEDATRWAGYITKEWRYSSEQLAQRTSIPTNDWALDWCELQEFFPAQLASHATPIKTHMDGSQVLDLDHLVWRRPGKGVLR